MDKPKVKPAAGPPKELERTVRTIKGVRSGIDKAADTVHKANAAKNALNEQISGENKYHRPEEYMTDKVSEKSEYAARKVGIKTLEKANEVIGKKLTSKPMIDSNIRKSQVKTYRKKTIANKLKKAIDSRLAARSAINTDNNPAKGVKSINRVKSTQKTVKTAERGLKVTVKGAKTAVKSAQKAAIVAKKVAVMTVKAVKLAVKAIIATVKGLISLIAAGGWVVIMIILIVTVILLIVSSPFGAFINDSDGTTPKLSAVVQQINGEYSATISNIIINAGEVDEIIFDGETASSGYTPSNWVDVLAVFSVKSTINDTPDEYMNVAFMDEKQVQALKNVFWKMNNISYEIKEEIIPTPEPTPSPTPKPKQSPTPSPDTSPTPEPTPEIYRTLIISTESKTFMEGAEIYRFKDEQMKVLNEMMSPQYRPMYMELCGMDSFSGLTPEQLTQLVNTLPEGVLGADIVRYALSRLGDPYSQKLRGQGNYVDCSYFTRWCYNQAEVLSFTAGTAAEQARYCVDNGLSISKNDLKRGDLIFWSFNANGRFLNITHVGIYAGDGMVIDASASRGMVVYRSLFGESNIVICGRPHVLN